MRFAEQGAMQIEHSEFQDRLVRGWTHRMNNILSLFHGYLGLLLEKSDESLNATTLEGLAKIKEGAKAASDLVDRTSLLVRPATAVSRELQVGELLEAVRPGLENLRGPCTDLQIVRRRDLPLIWGDPLRLRNAIFEVARNALEATADGGEVQITTELVEPPASTLGSDAPAVQWICVTVRDNGAGIEPTIRPRIFEPFFTARKRHATGLGLTVALCAVDQQGGCIEIESVPGKTCVRLFLPTRTPRAGI